jgi:hypothetical protein
MEWSCSWTTHEIHVHVCEIQETLTFTRFVCRRWLLGDCIAGSGLPERFKPHSQPSFGWWSSSLAVTPVLRVANWLKAERKRDRRLLPNKPDQHCGSIRRQR